MEIPDDLSENMWFQKLHFFQIRMSELKHAEKQLRIYCSLRPKLYRNAEHFYYLHLVSDTHRRYVYKPSERYSYYEIEHREFTDIYIYEIEHREFTDIYLWDLPNIVNTLFTLLYNNDNNSSILYIYKA